MNNLSPASVEPGDRNRRDSSSSIDHRATASDYNDRLTELEMENSRLHRLVAELLIKNQQLRKRTETS
jgi:hypothetical protein